MIRPIADLAATGIRWPQPQGDGSLAKNIEFRVLVVSVSALVIATSLNLLVDAGAVLHDLFCSTHGTLG